MHHVRTSKLWRAAIIVTAGVQPPPSLVTGTGTRFISSSDGIKNLEGKTCHRSMRCAPIPVFVSIKLASTAGHGLRTAVRSLVRTSPSPHKKKLTLQIKKWNLLMSRICQISLVYVENTRGNDEGSTIIANRPRYIP